jgi:iron complex outermembrane receptor protein
MLTKKLKIMSLSLAIFLNGGVAFAQSNSNPVYNIGQINVGSKQVSSKKKKIEKRYNRSILKLKDENIFKSAQTIKVIKKDQLKVAGPTGSASQVLSYAPGVTISSFGENGSRKFSLVLNGIRQGWGGFTGATGIDNGSLGVTFDGVPMVNPSTGLWQSNQIPQLNLIQGIRIIYGPGNPESRWYNDLGGQIQFVPLQPSKHTGGFVDLSYGSFNSRNLFLALNTGDIKGWRTIMAGGWGADNSYITSEDGFKYPAHNYAFYIKTKKVFANGDGDFSIGAYAAQSDYWRNPPIPVSPQQGLTADGTSNTPLLSQSTTGFYRAPDASVLHKLDQNGTDIVYSKLNLNFDESTKFHNMIWYRYGYREHDHYNNYPVGSNPSNLYEYNNPYDKVFGDKLWFELNNIYHNNISFGGYYLVSKYNSRNAFWNPSVELAPGVYSSSQVPNAKYRSNYWDQTDIAGFVQDAIKFGKFTFTPGLRWVDFSTDYNNATCSDFPLACQLNPKGDQGKLPSTHTNFSKLESSFDASYEIIDGVSIYGNYGETYKVPENGGGGGPYQSVQASELHLEKSQEYQIGFKVLKQKLKYANKIFAGVNYFHMIFSNLFFPISDSNGNYLGDGAGRSVYQGVNIFANYYPIKHLYLWTNTTFEDAKFPNYTYINTNGNAISTSNLPVSYVPHTLFNLGASYSYLIHGIITKPSIWFQYVGHQSMFNNNTGLPDTQKMPSYNTLNASISFDILNTTRSISYLKDVQLTLTALNITNKKYNEFEYISSGGYYGVNGGYIQAYPGAPFAIYASIRANF